MARGLVRLLAAFDWGLTRDPARTMSVSAGGRTVVVPVRQILADPNIAAAEVRLKRQILASLAVGGWTALGGVAVLLGIFAHRGRRLKQKRHVRGAKLVDRKRGVKLVAAHNRKRRGLFFEAREIAGVPYPAGAETMGTLVSGTVGGGKTQIFMGLIDQARRRGDRAIVYDKMGVFARAFYDPARDVVLNPLDARSPFWSPCLEARIASDLDAMAAAFIPEHQDSPDPFWSLAARVLFARIATAQWQNGLWGNGDLVDAALRTDFTEIVTLLKGSPAQSIIPENSPKTALSVRAIMSAYLQCLIYLRDDGKPFSIRDWVEDEDRDGFLFLVSRGDMHETIKPLISAWSEIAVNAILGLKQSRERRIWGFFDELPSLHKLPSILSALGETRQFGGCFVLGVQVYSQLKSIYGPAGAETISGLCRTRAILNFADDVSAAWASRNLGTREREVARESLSYGAHEIRDGVSITAGEEAKPLVTASEIQNLPSLSGYLRLPEGLPAVKFQLAYRDYPDVAEWFVPRKLDSRLTAAPPEAPGAAAERGKAAGAAHTAPSAAKTSGPSGPGKAVKGSGRPFWEDTRGMPEEEPPPLGTATPPRKNRGQMEMNLDAAERGTRKKPAADGGGTAASGGTAAAAGTAPATGDDAERNADPESAIMSRTPDI